MTLKKTNRSLPLYLRQQNLQIEWWMEILLYEGYPRILLPLLPRWIELSRKNQQELERVENASWLIRIPIYIPWQLLPNWLKKIKINKLMSTLITLLNPRKLNYNANDHNLIIILIKQELNNINLEPSDQLNIFLEPFKYRFKTHTMQSYNYVPIIKYSILELEQLYIMQILLKLSIPITNVLQLLYNLTIAEINRLEYLNKHLSYKWIQLLQNELQKKYEWYIIKDLQKYEIDRYAIL